jgi:hypothetical protein
LAYKTQEQGPGTLPTKVTYSREKQLPERWGMKYGQPKKTKNKKQ